MIKYKAGHYCSKMIEEVVVERETESSVWIGKRRLAKMSTYECYFDTWGDAKQHLVDKASGAVDLARRNLEYLRVGLEKVKALRGNFEGGER